MARLTSRQRSRLHPVPGDVESSFEDQLEIFRKEHEEAIQHLHAYLAIHRAAANRKQFAAFLNRTSLFWNTCLAALQTASIIALGRVFDQSSPHNIDALIGMAERNPSIFSKEALEHRILGQSADRPKWIDEILRDAYQPTPRDFRTIRTLVKKQRQIYQANYQDLRHHWFAHRVVSDADEIAELFARTNVAELKQLLGFLTFLYNELWRLFFNGRKLTLHDQSYQGENVGERVGKEVDDFVEYVLSGVRAPSPVDS